MSIISDLVKGVMEFFFGLCFLTIFFWVAVGFISKYDTMFDSRVQQTAILQKLAFDKQLEALLAEKEEKVKENEESDSVNEKLLTLIELMSNNIVQQQKASAEPVVQQEESVPIKINRKSYRTAKKMAKLVKKHKKLEDKLLKNLAKVNYTTEEKVGEALYKYNFMIDYDQHKAKMAEPVSLDIQDKQRTKLMKIDRKVGQL